MNPTQGRVLNGRYTLTEGIAVGGMGEVWAATDNVLARTVAVKLLHPALSQEVDFVERFRSEARLTASLHHPNIATVFDYGEDDGTAYLVMELVAGLPLNQIIAERAPLSAAETASILAQAATALEAAHQGGVVHRDVKPANIIITPDGTAKLTDFGISRAIDSAPMTQTGQVLGTAQYLSPEQALGQAATASSDIYSLGVVGYEMLMGERPFEAETVVATALAHVNQPAPALPDSVPAAVRDVVSAALAKNPADRPATAAAVAQALGMPGAALPLDSQLATAPFALASQNPTNATEPTPTMPTPTQVMAAPQAPTRAMPAQPAGIPEQGSGSWGPRRRLWLLGGSAVVVILAVVTATALSGGDGAARPKAPAAPVATSSTSHPSITATTAISPSVTSSVPTKPAPGNGGDHGKKKGK